MKNQTDLTGSLSSQYLVIPTDIMPVSITSVSLKFSAIITLILVLMALLLYSGTAQANNSSVQPSSVISPISGSDFVSRIYLSGIHNKTSYYTVLIDQPNTLRPCNVVDLDGRVTIHQAKQDRCDATVFGPRGATIGFWHKDVLTDNLILTTYIISD